MKKTTKKSAKKVAPKKAAAKKPAPKKAAAKKPVAKKPAKKVAKPAKKAAPKKAVKKVVKPAKKAAPKKAVKKVVAKKVVAKKPIKKVVTKTAAKPAKKVTASKNVAKKPVKKAGAKNAPKPLAKKSSIPEVKAGKRIQMYKRIAAGSKSKSAIKVAVKTVAAPKPIAKPKVKKAEVKAPAKPVVKPTVKAEPKKIEKTHSVVKKEVVKVEEKKIDIVIPPPVQPSIKKPEPVAKLTGPNDDKRTRYNDEELQEFKELIQKKLDSARSEYSTINEAIQSIESTGYLTLEDGSTTEEKERLSQMAARQKKYVENLENALMRVENKTYGICKVTGKLISKERLRAVPHTTQSIEAKLQQYK